MEPQEKNNVYSSIYKNLVKVEEALWPLPKLVGGEGKLIWQNEKFQFESRRFYLSEYCQSGEALHADLIKGLEAIAYLAYEILNDLRIATRSSAEQNVAVKQKIVTDIAEKEDLIKENPLASRKVTEMEFSALISSEELAKLREIEVSLLGISRILSSYKKSIEKLNVEFQGIRNANIRISANIGGLETVLSKYLKEKGVDLIKLKRSANINSGLVQKAKDFNSVVDSQEAASIIVNHIPKYKANLATLDVLPGLGLVISGDLVEDCIGDALLINTTNRKAIRDTSNCKELFNNVLPLKIPQSRQVWKAQAIKQSIKVCFGEQYLTERKIEIKDNAAFPTSLRDIESPQLNHLANFKVQIDSNDGHLCITCGVIDTRKKADEFVAGVIEALKNARKTLISPIPLRIVLHQVNSRYMEPKLVLKQHEMSRYIEKCLRTLLNSTDEVKEADVLPAKEKLTELDFTESTEDPRKLYQLLGFKDFCDKIPIVSHIITSLNATSTLHSSLEDAPCYKLNLEGLVAQCFWVMEDLGILSLKEEDKFVILGIKLMKTFQEISNLKIKIDELKNNESVVRDPILESIKSQIEMIKLRDLNNADVVKQLSELEGIKNSMKKLQLENNPQYPLITSTEALLKLQQTELLNGLKEMLELYKPLPNFFSEMISPTPKEIMESNKVKVLCLLIAKQIHSLDSSSNYSRNQEVELFLVLYMMLGAITEINCKSGLDRTGLARSMWDSLRSMKDQFSLEFIDQGIEDPKKIEARTFEKLIDLILSQDDLTKELDNLQLELIPIFEGSIARNLNEVSEKTATLSMRKKLTEAIKAKHPNDLKKVEALLNALKYQDLIGANLLCIAQPATIDSTGVAGLKYGHGTSGMMNLGKNPHPLKRLPMFISTEDGKIIQLYEVRYALIGTEDVLRGIGAEEHYFTSAGVDLIERLSQQRGD